LPSPTPIEAAELARPGSPAESEPIEAAELARPGWGPGEPLPSPTPIEAAELARPGRAAGRLRRPGRGCVRPTQSARPGATGGFRPAAAGGELRYGVRAGGHVRYGVRAN
jgi:hypothetical protein